MLSVIIPVGYLEPHIKERVIAIKDTIGNVDYEILVLTIDKEVCTEISEARVCLHAPWNCAEARNYGEKMSKGDILVFSDAHTEYGDLAQGWGEVLEDTFRKRSDIGVATFPRYTLTGDIDNIKRYLNQIARGLKFNSDTNLLDVRYVSPRADAEIPFIWGDFHVIRRSVFEEVGGYTTEGWGHFEDRNMCIACTLFGYKNICIEGKTIGAYIRPPGAKQSFPYWWLGNMCCHGLHYTGNRLERAKQFWVQDGHTVAEFELVFNRWTHLRDYYLNRRVHDDTWYFDVFLRMF